MQRLLEHTSIYIFSWIFEKVLYKLYVYILDMIILYYITENETAVQSNR